MKVALEIRAGRPRAMEFAENLSDRIRRSGGTVITDAETAPDVVIAVGGDGTMLAAVRHALAFDSPVLGFNLGTLGFLTEAEPDDLDPIVTRLIAGDFEISERMTVAASIGGVSALGINDVVVEKVDTTRLVSLEVVVDDAEFATYHADGLVIATPTGSTAYSFSAGGPLVDPLLDALVMTPVASHSLFERSIVLPPQSQIDITVTKDRLVRVNVDKCDLGELGEGETVSITRGDRKARFITFGAPSFPELVKDKFDLD